MGRCSVTGGARRAVFLDRDGVINRAVVRDGKPYAPATLAELQIVPDCAEALADLKKLGFLLVVVTNQPDVGRGTQQREVVDRIHDHLQNALPLDDIFACYHTDGDACDCRKPQTGLIRRASEKFGIDMAASYLIGDRWRDIEAGERAGCKTVMIDYGYTEQAPSVGPAVRVRSLREATDWIAERHRSAVSINSLKVKLFADGADKGAMLELYANPLIQGFTTNPTIMRKAGITCYEAFARDILTVIRDRPISFEVFADDFQEMERQAHEIAGWSDNVNVKIPVTNSRAEPALDLIRRLSSDGVKVNVTALLTLNQVREVTDALEGGAPAYVSVFAGRIADTGRDPVPLMAAAVEILRPHPQVELIWASPRELLNVFHADSVGCHIITATSDVLKKLCLIGKDLGEYSLETVRMFRNDALQAGYEI
jgi:transaldolase